MKLLFACIFVLVLLSACGTPNQQAASTPTTQLLLTKTVTATVTSTATAKEKPTEPATETAIPTTYHDIGIENWQNNVVPSADILNGEYFAHLQAIAPTTDNPSNLPQVQCVGGEQIIFYENVNKSKFNIPGPSTLSIGNYSVLTILKNALLDPYGTYRDDVGEVLLPSFMYSQSAQKYVPVLFYLYHYSVHNPNISQAQANAEIARRLKYFTKPFLSLNFLGYNFDPRYLSPLEYQSYVQNPDYKDRLQKFYQTCDPAYISSPGLIIDVGVPE